MTAVIFGAFKLNCGHQYTLSVNPSAYINWLHRGIQISLLTLRLSSWKQPSFGQKTQPYKSWKLGKVIRVIEVSGESFIYISPLPWFTMNWPIRAKNVLLMMNPKKVLWLKREDHKLLFSGMWPKTHRKDREEQLQVSCSGWSHAASESDPWSMKQIGSVQSALTLLEMGVTYFWMYLDVQHINGHHKLMFTKESVPD